MPYVRGVFVGNSAVDAAGALANVSARPLISECVFNGNESGYCGGAIYNGESDFASSVPTIKSCTFAYNSPATGGGIFNTLGNPSIGNSDSAPLFIDAAGPDGSGHQ